VLDGEHGADTTNVVTTDDVDSAEVLEFNDAFDFAVFQVKFDGIVLLDVWMGEADGPAVVRDDVRDLVLAENLVLNLAEFEVCFLVINTNRLEATLQVVEHAEVLVCLHNLDNVHQAEWVLVVASNLAIHFDVVILVIADLLYLLAGKSVVESLSDKDRNRDALAQLVWASVWARRATSLLLVEHPVGWCVHSLQVLLGTSCL